ncbi:MAG: transporter substrate-binding domain-containing protein [Paraglaciecola sp.]|uniref:substrate-binding periplasmic protein n=1 Tax=Paraglaciecola sp. TaxID=1920173 RepID=UPI00329817E2
MCANLSHAKAKNIQVVTEYFQNYQFKTENGYLSGFAVEVVNEIFEKTEFTADIHVLPWGRALKTAKEEKNTLIFSIARTQARQKHFKWIGILSREPQFVWGLKERFPHKIKRQEDLKPFHFVVIRNTNPDDVLTELGFSQIIRVSTEQQLVGMLYKHRVDFVASGEEVMRYRLASQGFDFRDITAVHSFDNLSSDLGIAMNVNSDPKVLEAFEKAFIELKQSGELSALKKKWKIKF